MKIKEKKYNIIGCACLILDG